MKPKVGLIVLTIPQEISPIPKKAKEIMEDYSKRAEKSLKKNNLDIIRIAELIDKTEVSKEKIRYLINENVYCVIFMIGAWPSPALAIDAIDKLNRRIPIILWAFPDDTILSLVPACQFHGAFDDMGIEHDFIYSEPEDSKFTDKIKKLAAAAFVVNKLNSMNLGLFGGRYMHMYTGTADPIQVKEVFGVEITHINEFCLVDEAKKIDSDKVKKFSDHLHNKYGKITTPPDVEEKSIRLYFAMKKLANENNLDFASVKCMLEVHGSYCSHCLSVSQNLDEGFVVSCEGDINAALTMQILKVISNSAPGFGDIHALYMDDNILRIANCGTFPTEFAENPKDVCFSEQYAHLVPGPGTGMVTTYICRPGKVTLARLGRINREYVMQISSGTAVSVPKEKLTKGWEKLPHIFINIDGNANEFLQNCRSNHIHWVYGEFVEELKEICRILKK